jgi:DNA-binding SARP family transcriptional activator
MSPYTPSREPDRHQMSATTTATTEHANSESSRPVLRAFLLGSFTLEQADGGSIDVPTSIGRSQSILLLKLLLCHPQRQVARDLLTEIIWPGQSYSIMDGSLSVAKSLLKTGLQALCGQAVLPRANGDPPGYRLVGQNVLWTDIDACEQSIRRAIATTNATEALVQWEAVYALLQRGALLADDQAAYWYQARLVQDRRKKLAKQRVQCVLRIADLALECSKPDQAVTVLDEEREVHPANEEIALQLMEILAQRGQLTEALHCYARLEAALLERDREPGAEMQALVHRLRSKGTTRASVNRHVLFQQEEMGRSVTGSVDNLPTQDKDADEMRFSDNSNNVQKTNLEAFPIQSQENNMVQNTISSRIPVSQPIQLHFPGDTPVSLTIQVHKQAPTHQLLSTGEAIFPLIDGQVQNASYFQYEGTAIPTMGPGSEAVKRRDFLRETGRAAVGFIGAELLDRFYRAVEKPSTLDDATLNYLHRRTGSYWHDRNDAVLASRDLLNYVLDDYRRVIELLEGSLFPHVRAHLCSVAGNIALLAGTLFYDMSFYSYARNYYKAAIRAAQEGNNPTLQSVAWAWMSFTWTQSDNGRQALVCIQEARRLSERSANSSICAWFAAIEAEIQAKRGNLDACLKALDGAEHSEEQKHSLEDTYWIYFDASQLASYEGVCRLELCRSGGVLADRQKTSLLVDAQKASADSLILLHPTLTQRRPIYLSTLAGVYIQQREIEEACERVIQATSIVAQTKSKTVLQRLLKLRHELEPWKDTLYVERLDTHMRPLLTSEWQRGSSV